jgi:hypothetical protein
MKGFDKEVIFGAAPLDFNSGENYDYSDYTIHASVEAYIMQNTKLVSSTAVGHGPIHMKSVNGGDLFPINIFQTGPFTQEQCYLPGGSQKLTLSIGEFYMSLKVIFQNFSIGFVTNYRHFSTGYEIEAPTAILMLLAIPIDIASTRCSNDSY